jgi:tRNA A-37 threonylcarbamoyl transferase component Bud32
MSSAASALVLRVIDAERARGARSLALVRLGAAGLGLLVVAGSGASGDAGMRAAVIPCAIYLAVSLALFAGSRFSRFALAAAPFSIPLIDVPFLTLAQYADMRAASNPGVDPFRYSALSLYCAAIAASAIMMSLPVLLSTCASSLAGGALLYALLGAPPGRQALVALGPIVTAAFCGFVVTRLRALVEEARRADLMGKYILGPRIGAGGMAEVYRATYAPEGGFERQVAVKRVLPAYASDASFVERFRREAELTARLVHPNIVQVLDFGCFESTYFLAMELVDGASLHRISRQTQLPLCAVAYVAQQLAEALDFIHSRTGDDGKPLGLVHRDMNPPNVLVSRHGEIKLADFGVARAAETERLTATGAFVGKLTYLAPELVQGAAYDGRVDMFALGLTLHALITGRRAVESTSEVAILKELVEANFPPPSQLREGVPPVLDALVLGLLNRDVAQRSTAAMLKRQLLELEGPVADLAEGRRVMGELVSQHLAADAA